MAQADRDGGCEWMQNSRECGDAVVATLADDRENGLGEMAVCKDHRDLWKNKDWAEVK
jgi:hypothetical protein